MEIVFADVAPEPSVVARPLGVVVLLCLAVIAAVVVLIVWLVRRNKK